MTKSYNGSVTRVLDTDNRAWETVVYQSAKPILDSEQNLIQDVATAMGRDLIKATTPSGWLYGDFLSGNAVGIPGSRADFELMPTTPNQFKFTNGPVALVDGSRVVVEYTNSTTAGENVITLDPPPDGLTPGTMLRTDLVYLEVWRALLGAASGTNKSSGGRIWRNGNTGVAAAEDLTLNYADDIQDPGAGAETTKRVQVQYRIGTVPNIGIEAHPEGIDDPAVFAWGAHGGVTAFQFTHLIRATHAALKAYLALGTYATNLNTVVEAYHGGTAGNDLTIATVADGTGPGAITRVGNAFTIHYATGVTTVANVEALIAGLTGANQLIQVKTAGTGTNILNSTLDADTFSAKHLSFGEDVYTEGDYGLWRAGDGDPTNELNTVDGYSYAIPICAVFRRNTDGFRQEDNHNGGVLLSTVTCDRPDGLFADTIGEGDILDLRKGVTLSGWDFDEVLEKSFSALLDDDLAQQEQNTQSVPAYSGGSVGTLVLHADEIGNGTNLGGTTIGKHDGVRRRWSDRAIVERPVVVKTPAAAYWVEGEKIVIDLTVFSPYPLTTPTVDVDDAVITGIRAYWDGPVGVMGKTEAFF
jgi:hypothetical protein